MVKVLKPGFYSTIQDMGRLGYQDYGIPDSGTMDQYSAQFANAILNNDKNDAVLEMTMTGPKLQFDCHTSICISGADMSPELNGSEIKLNSLIPIKPNDILSFGKVKEGFRSYLAVSGGFKSELKLKSRSMFKNITSKVKIESEDNLTIKESNPIEKDKHAHLKFNSLVLTSDLIEVFKGPEFDLLTIEQQKQLQDQEFTISNLYDRMAYQFVQLLPNNLKPIITSPVLPGTVQLTPSGNLIVLMRDCQTTGGYPRILQLKETSINVLAQKYQRNTIRFRLLS